jgi:diaminobutyrate-2-oxoglutarate transaminase
LHQGITTRGVGLVWGVDLSALGGDAFSRKIMTCCFEKGLVLERVGRDNAVMKIMPPLTIDTDTLLKGLTILKEVIKEQIEVKA